jgi:hypothetical protein
MKYFVKFTHVVEREVVCEVNAESESEAIKKAKDGNYESDDEEFCVENSIETKNYKIIKE